MTEQHLLSLSLSLDIDLPPELDSNLDTLVSFLGKDPPPSVTFMGMNHYSVLTLLLRS